MSGGGTIPYLTVARTAVRAAAALLVSDLPGKPPRPGSVTAKARSDFQTDIDLLLERRITETILAQFPDHGVVGEEYGAQNAEAEYVWYIDPLDGTRNLLEGRPEIAVAAGLYRRGAPVLGAIFLPCRGLELAACTGTDGLLVNGAAYTPPPAPAGLDSALLGMPGDLAKETKLDAWGRLMAAVAPRVDALRITGALAYDLAAMALGELTARISLTAKVVDMAAGAILVTQTGGVVTDSEGRPWTLASRSLLAARTPALHSALLHLVNDVGGTSPCDSSTGLA